MIEIEGYLVQHKLEDALRTIVGMDQWCGREIVLTGTRKRWDMAFRAGGQVTVVEFDGDEHYRNSLKIRDDRAKDEIAAAEGLKVVRFPYWIQLTTETLRHFFGLDAVVTQNFPHGFITTKLFPASFCEQGVNRFTRELDSLPSGVREAVVKSLYERVDEYGAECVLPSALHGLL